MSAPTNIPTHTPTLPTDVRRAWLLQWQDRIESRMVDSTIFLGTKRMAYNVQYAIDNTHQEFEDEEIRPLLVIAHLPERKKILDGIIPAFKYLESRLTDTCETSSYSCEHMYEVIPPHPSCSPLPPFHPTTTIAHTLTSHAVHRCDASWQVHSIRSTPPST